MGKKEQELWEAGATLAKVGLEETVAAKNAEADKINAALDEGKTERQAQKTAATDMQSKIDNAKCSNHPGCSGLSGLHGYCCPALDTNKMHLGSSKLEGERLDCCSGGGSAPSMASDSKPSSVTNLNFAAVGLATKDTTVAASASGNFGITSMLLATISGSAVTTMVFKLTSGKEEKNAPYQPLA